jgi:hypothetical protein
MATPSPAPSRAAIHALRGVLLTTSCSVILLAEERRRRLNIARAALDNAKKLHTARVNRNSTALAESYSSRREAFPVEITHDFSHAPTNNPLRRRRQRIDSLENGLSRPREIEALEIFETRLPEDTDSTSTPQARQRRWDEWDAARKELSRISETSSFAHNGLQLKLSPEIALPTAPPPNQRSRTRARGTRTGIESNISKTTLQSKTSEGVDGRAEATVSEPVNEASWSHLDTILAEMESPDMLLALRVEQERKAAKMLQALTSAEAEEPQEIILRGIRLLQSTAVSREYDTISLILEAVQPVCTDVCLLAVPFFDNLLQNHDTEGVRHLLRRLSGFVPRPVKGTLVENRNEWITRLLMHHWRKTKNFDEVKSVYGMLQEGGLFSDGIFSLSTQ